MEFLKQLSVGLKWEQRAIVDLSSGQLESLNLKEDEIQLLTKTKYLVVTLRFSLIYMYLGSILCVKLNNIEEMS